MLFRNSLIFKDTMKPTSAAPRKSVGHAQAELKQRLEAFIEYFNRTLAKPFRWTYQGKPLAA